MRYLSLMLLTTIPACITGARDAEINQYTIRPTFEIAPTEPTGLAIAVRPLRGAKASGRNVAYLDDGLRVGYYRTHKWAEEPEDMVTDALLDALSSTGRFGDVGLAIDLTRPDLLLTGDLRTFHIDRTEATWQAVVEFRLELRQGLQRDAVWADTIRIAIPLQANDVASLPGAMSEAVGRAVSQAANAIAAAVRPAPAEKTEG